MPLWSIMIRGEGLLSTSFIHYFVCQYHQKEVSDLKLFTTLYGVNSPATVTCLSSGGPNNTIMWLLDGVLIPGETSDALTLVEVDGGEYTCIVSNSAGNGTATITLTGE